MSLSVCCWFFGFFLFIQSMFFLYLPTKSWRFFFCLFVERMKTRRLKKKEWEILNEIHHACQTCHSLDFILFYCFIFFLDFLRFIQKFIVPSIYFSKISEWNRFSTVCQLRKKELGQWWNLEDLHLLLSLNWAGWSIQPLAFGAIFIFSRAFSAITC